MPTIRLSDPDRSQIEHEFNAVLFRALFNKPFPIEQDDIKEWGRSLLSQEEAKHWNWLREYRPELAREGGYWRGEFKLETRERIYELSADDNPMPFDGIFVPNDHKDYDDVLTWAIWYNETNEAVSTAQSWLSKCICHCHSVGQVKRVLGEEIIKFVPNSLRASLANSERQSRIPRGLNINKERHELLCNMLTLGSISPDERKSAHVIVENIQEKEI